MALQLALLTPSGRSDDGEALLLSQSLAWGYQSKNPPGFYWLAHILTQITGPYPAAIFALRMMGIFWMFAGLYAIARRVQPDPMLAACAGFAMLASVNLHWYLFFYQTNTTLALAIAPALVLALFRIGDRPTLGSCALFGVVLGLGMLARYNFAIFGLALVAAALVAPEWRTRLVQPRMLIAIAVAAAMLAPHAIWAVQHWPTLSADVQDQLVGSAPAPYAARVATGFRKLFEAAASVLLAPLGILALVCFPRAFRPIAVAGRQRASEIALLGRTVVVGLGLVAAFVLTGSSFVKPHHLIFLVLAPIWLIGRLDAVDLRRWAGPGFAAGLGLCVALALVAYPATSFEDARHCRDCEEFQPMDAYAAGLRAAGFRHGTIVALSRREQFPAAALLARLPGSRLVAFDYHLYRPPPGPAPGDCLLVWSGDAEWPPSWQDPPTGPVPGIGVPLPPGTVFGRIDGELHLSGRPAGGMRYALVEGGIRRLPLTRAGAGGCQGRRLRTRMTTSTRTSSAPAGTSGLPLSTAASAGASTSWPSSSQ